MPYSSHCKATGCVVQLYKSTDVACPQLWQSPELMFVGSSEMMLDLTSLSARPLTLKGGGPCSIAKNKKAIWTAEPMLGSREVQVRMVVLISRVSEQKRQGIPKIHVVK